MRLIYSGGLMGCLKSHTLAMVHNKPLLCKFARLEGSGPCASVGTFVHGSEQMRAGLCFEDLLGPSAAHLGFWREPHSISKYLTQLYLPCFFLSQKHGSGFNEDCKIFILQIHMLKP